MKHLFIMDDLRTVNVYGDSTFMLMLEAQNRGWPVFSCHPNDMFVIQGSGYAHVKEVGISPDRKFIVKDQIKVELGEFQVIWMRKDPPFDMAYIFSTYILELVPKSTLVLNRPSSIRSSNEKMFALQWPELSPPTLVSRRIDQAREWAKTFDRVVIKPWDGNGGRGVLVSEYTDPNFRSMLEILTQNESQYILVQKYLPEIHQGDKRIILVDGETVGWMSRIPQAGDHRGNMHVGAQVASFDLSDRDREICKELRPKLKEMGLLFVGIDIIGSYLTEINVTSPTGIQEINPMFNIQVERIITDAVQIAYNKIS
jgi:glutathione synthase